MPSISPSADDVELAIPPEYHSPYGFPRDLSPYGRSPVGSEGAVPFDEDLRDVLGGRGMELSHAPHPAPLGFGRLPLAVAAALLLLWTS